MTKKLFTAEMFRATEWDTAADKAKFANHFVRFVEGGFKETLFPNWFYKRLSMTFGHIAHYDIHGFYSVWFTTTHNRRDFLKHCLRNGGYGDDRFTYCDVERKLWHWIEASGLVAKLGREIDAANEASERAMLSKLKAKYETTEGS